MILTFTYPNGEMHYRYFPLKSLEVPKHFFFIFVSLFRALKGGLKCTAKPIYASLHLSQVIKYMTFLLLQERSPFMKNVLPVTLDVNFISGT